MPITKETVAQKLAAYLHHDLALAALVAWAEDAMNDGEFDAAQSAAICEVVSRLGVADVQAFGLTWEDCEGLLRILGYSARVEVTPS